MINPGSELDALVAKHVFGEDQPEPYKDGRGALNMQLCGKSIQSVWECWAIECRYDEGDVPIWVPKPFSTNLNAAWKVLLSEKSRFNCVRSLSSCSGPDFTLSKFNVYDKGVLVVQDQWQLEYLTPGGLKKGPLGISASHCICLAALEACGYNIL